MRRCFLQLSLTILLIGLWLPGGAQRTVMVAKGFGSQVYFPEGTIVAAYPNLIEQVTYLARLQSGYALDQPFPKSVDALRDVRGIVLADIPASALSGFMGRRALRQYVERGGSLLYFGGPLAFGKGGVAGSFLEDIFPVTVTGPWDQVKAANPAVRIAKSSPLTQDLRWNDSPKVYYYHKVIPKPGVDILLTCDGSPILVTGRYGKGRVAVVMATNLLGGPHPNETFFFQWSGYRPLLQRVLYWLLYP
ncbi:MAG: glutamine amidotransferase [Armatimonadota bacterium]